MIHNEEWFAQKERLVSEPFNNTRKYYLINETIFCIIHFIIYVSFFDYTGSFRSVEFLQSVLSQTGLESTWIITIIVSAFILWFGLQVLSLIITLIRMKKAKSTAFFVVLHIITLFPITTLSMFEKTAGFVIHAAFQVVGYGLKITTFFLMKKHVCDAFESDYLHETFLKQSESYMDKARSITLTGAPGTGKTVFGGTISFIVAQKRWQKLKFDYFCEQARKKYYIKTCNVAKLKRLDDLKSSYDFYHENELEFIPCLVTRIPIQDSFGRYSYQLKDEVFAQIERLPEYTVIFNDESGRTQGCDTSKSASDDVFDFWRLNRHFGDFTIINTEQGDDGNAKYIRKCTDYNIRCYYQEWALKPEKLIERFEKKKEKTFSKIEEGKFSVEKQRYVLQELFYQSEYIKTIGYRRIKVSKVGTPEQGRFIQDDEIIILPSRPIYFYDDRSYSDLYKCREYDINLNGWTCLAVENDGLDSKRIIVTNE